MKTFLAHGLEELLKGPFCPKQQIHSDLYQNFYDFFKGNRAITEICMKTTKKSHK